MKMTKNARKTLQDGSYVEFNGDHGDKKEGRYLTLVMPATRGQTSPYTVTHEFLIANLDAELQRLLWETLSEQFRQVTVYTPNET